MEYDIWKSDDGALCAKPAEAAFVDDGDAPYGYDRHELRVTADSKRDALRQYYAQRN